MDSLLAESIFPGQYYTHGEERLSDDGQPLRGVGLSVERRVGGRGEHAAEHIQEELQRELVQEVDLVQRLQHEVDAAARLGDRTERGRQT